MSVVGIAIDWLGASPRRVGVFAQTAGLGCAWAMFGLPLSCRDCVHLLLRYACTGMEVACKRASSADGREDNEEYEFGALPSDYGRAVDFFHALGHEDFFLKHKTGWEWNDGDAHIELLQVNDIGTFLEIEVLLPFGCPDTDVGRAYSHILRLLADAGMDDMDIERRSYRQMILEKEGIDGIQG